MFGSSFRNATSLDLEHEVIDGVVEIRWKIKTLTKYHPTLIGIKTDSTMVEGVQQLVRDLRSDDPEKHQEMSDAFVGGIAAAITDPGRVFGSSGDRRFLETQDLSGKIEDANVEPGTTVFYTFYMKQPTSAIRSILTTGLQREFLSQMYRIEVPIPGKRKADIATKREPVPRETVESLQAEIELLKKRKERDKLLRERRTRVEKERAAIDDEAEIARLRRQKNRERLAEIDREEQAELEAIEKSLLSDDQREDASEEARRRAETERAKILEDY